MVPCAAVPGSPRPTFVASLGAIVALLIALPAVPGFVGGIALLKGWGWSRPLLIVVTLFNPLRGDGV